ncbi:MULTISPECIES: PadR family transcriptional regulator [unclassified Nocardioides]|jgi:DNA-binding PadR family transcriptional regulator|uniref:PadR family transcriptional regulator n=1 Tax=unclassified Nocardioides TaxID=2615069 RepID=UPI0007027C9C|nr:MULTISPECIES: PadR family transcriptional regulator [unclassified Nocardioides]KRC53009.1 PadR family transcriptional regulator [Nocardioides sp. Root79]KRC72538.1 PadR family transcriptional regulator [Nocardioides sp. Root240]
MAAHDTRMLLLGAVALFEPVNGYQIRRELLSWSVDDWANLQPGSIYNGLATLTRQGRLVRHDLEDGGREVAVYELTESGRAELERLVTAGLEDVGVVDRKGFSAAFGLLPLVPHEHALRSLVRRRVALEQLVARLADPGGPAEAPPHALRGVVLWLDLAVAELAWLRETIELMKSGSLRLDSSTWVPPADDPGWQMNADRERYRTLLGR